MKKLTALQKANIILLEDRIFLLTSNENFVYYKVRGETDSYDVTFDRRKVAWNCTCKNIRMSDCSHIIAGKRTMEGGVI